MIILLILLQRHSTEHFVSDPSKHRRNRLQSQANTFFHYVPQSCENIASYQCDNIDCYNAVRANCLNQLNNTV